MSDDRGAARAARDQGIKQAIDHADAKLPRWSDRALEVLRAYIRSPEIGEFTAEDVRAYAGRVGLPQPPHLRAWGGVFQRAVKAGWIERAGTTQARAAHVHCAIITVWRRAGAAAAPSREAVLEELLRGILEAMPPCGDCVERSHLRELVESAERELAGRQ